MSSQIQNLKSRTTKEKIKHIAILFFSLFLTLAVFSQISAAKPKPTTVVGLNKADWLYYKSSNDLTAYLGKKSSNLPTVRYQKGGDYLEFSLNQAAINNQTTDIATTSSVSLETDTKTPNTPTLFYRNILDGVDANYQITNLPFKVKEEIVLKNPPAALERSYGGSASGGKSLTFLFSAETTGKPVKQDDGSVAFFGDNGEYLFQLDKPFMVDGRGIISNEVSIEIKPTSDVGWGRINKTKTADKSAVFGDSNLERKSGLSPVIDKYTGIKTFVNSLYNKYVNNKKVLDLGGIEPPDSQVTNRSPHQVRPRTGLFYHKENLNLVNKYTLTLSANSDWLSTATYPVVIDPTVTHNADANFTGQFNRIADADTTSSAQLEASYPEATKDPYTVLLLHFNEANGTTAGIRDMASTTRVITATGNASTTSYVTQLGLGNSAAFDGTGDYLSAPDSDDWNFGSGEFSIETWVNFTSLPTAGDERHLVTQWVEGSSNRSFRFGIVESSGLMLLKYAYSTSGSSFTGSISSSAQSLSASKWYHVATIRSGNTLSMYLDGKNIGSGDLTGVTIYNASVNLNIGQSETGGFNLNGHLDPLRITKGRALTPEEIKAAASRRPYSVYTSPVVDATASVTWNTLNWTEGGVATGNGEQPYSTNSLVAQWDFNDTSGTTLTASSSGSCTTACNGTLTNFAYTASQDQATTTTGWTANNKKWGAGALMMESAASADYVSIADPASNVLDPNSADLTIETWIKTSDTSAEIFSNNNGNGTACTNNGYYFGIDSSGYPVFYLDTNGVTAGCDAQISSSISTKINDGNWHKVAVSVTRGTSAIIYVDGKSAGSDTSVTSYSAITVTGNAFLGGSAGGLDAILDSSRFYSRALSAAEILSNYNAGNIEIQTRTGATSDSNDGSWEAWKPTTGETQLFSLDSDAVNWHSDIMASTTIATSTETVIKAEGSGSLKIRTGMASTTAGTVALWHMEETGTTTGTYLYDETANNNDATTTGTTVVDGIFGKGRKFNGTSDVISALALTGGTAAQSVDFWVYPLTTTEYFIDLNGSAYVWANAGTVTATGFTSPTIYVNGAVSSIIVAGQWQHIAITTGTGINASAPKIGKTTTNYLEGTIDEVKVSNRALSADEIAETYRMGANHHLTRQVSATDLSAQTKLAFWIAADRPGTGLEAMLGESDYANYELASSTLALSTNTVLYIKGDEIASSTSIKDSSFSGKAITANGNARTAGGGKIGNSVYFDGTGDYLSLADSDDWDFGSGNFSVETWIKEDSIVDWAGIVGSFNAGTGWGFLNWSGSAVRFRFGSSGATDLSLGTVSTGVWYHLAAVRSGNTGYVYLNGQLVGAVDVTGQTINAAQTFVYLGSNTNSGEKLNGYIDETRIIKGTALTADQIRQAYEYGLRTHPITIDFGATLQSSDLISSATDYNFSLTATTSGLSATTSGLYLGDKIIIKENLGGTEYTAQGTVNAINTTTGAITVPSWDTGSTFPSGNGYSPNATVFKWQREYFDLTGSLSTHRDAITNLTLRPTNGAEGRTIYLDDFRYNTNYLTASSSSAITSSNGRYLQYRAVFSSWDNFVSPYLSAFNTLYTALANSFPAIIGISGGGFLSF